MQRTGEAYLKLSLNAYSFNDALRKEMTGDTSGMSPVELLEFCADYNFDAIDFTGYPEVPSDSAIYAFKKKAFLLGLDISGTGVRNDFAQENATNRANDVKMVKKWIDVAAKLGAPVIRVFAGKMPKNGEEKRDSIAEYMAACLKECAAYGAKRGVIVGVQNHGGFLYTAEQCIDMVKRVNSEWFGIIIDIGHFKTEDPYLDVEKLMPYAVNFQLKESPYGNKSLIKTDFNRLIKIIYDIGYRGYLPIETLVYRGTPSIPYYPKIKVPALLKEVKAAIDEQY